MKLSELREIPDPSERELETRLSVTHVAVVQDEETGIVRRMPIRFNLGLGGGFRPCPDAPRSDAYLGAVGGE